MALPKGGKILFASMAIVEFKGNYFFAKRKDNSLWNFPGGGVEYGEKGERAISREIFEETGIRRSPSEYKFLFAQETIVPKMNLHVVFLVYHLELLKEPKIRLNGESAEFGWFPLNRPPKGLTPGTKQALSGFLSGEKGGYNFCRC